MTDFFLVSNMNIDLHDVWTENDVLYLKSVSTNFSDDVACWAILLAFQSNKQTSLYTWVTQDTGRSEIVNLPPNEPA